MVGERKVSLAPGSGVHWLPAGVHAPMDLGNGQNLDATPFSVELILAGTQRFAVAPVGDQSDLEVSATWPHPSFSGDFLPVEREVSKSGFVATWAVSALARGVPRSFRYESHIGALHGLLAAVDLFEPVTIYTTVDRGIKYGILFIGMTFLTAVCFELLSGRRFHLVQYGVVGAALVLFYLTLLSLAEHMALAITYVIATGVTVAMLGAYAHTITRSFRATASFVGAEGVLYGVLYILLKMEDFALLAGTMLLLVGLAVLMVVTRGLSADRNPLEESLPSR